MEGQCPGKAGPSPKTTVGRKGQREMFHVPHPHSGPGKQPCPLPGFQMLTWSFPFSSVLLGTEKGPFQRHRPKHEGLGGRERGRERKRKKERKRVN